MGVSMDVISELQGPVDDRTVAPEGHEFFWDWDAGCYTAKRHPEIPYVGWTYGNLIGAWDEIIAEYPGHEAVARIGSEGIILPDEVEAILEYLITVEPKPEHGEEFVRRLTQLKELFGHAAALSGGGIYNS